MRQNTMPISYADRYKITDGKALKERVNVAIWDKAFRVIADPQSTADDRAVAFSRARGNAPDVEMRVTLIAISANPKLSGAIDDLSDEVLQQIVDTVYPNLPPRP